jgi:hypothetical protein
MTAGVLVGVFGRRTDLAAVQSEAEQTTSDFVQAQGTILKYWFATRWGAAEGRVGRVPRSAGVRKTPAAGCHIAACGDLVPKHQVRCHHLLLAAEESSHDEQWVLALQAQPDCRPWAHNQVQLEDSTPALELEQSAVQETRVCC